MDYNSVPIKKVVQCPEDNTIFETNANASSDWCPTCGSEVSFTVYPIQYFKVYDSSSGLGPSTPQYYLTVAPNNLTRIHAVFMISTNGSSVTLELYSDSTITDVGTPVATFNNDNNKQISNPSEFLVYKNPTVVDGVQKVVTKLIAGVAPRKPLTPDEEIIVAQNSTYVMKIIPSVSSTDIALELIWMEVK